jgi:integrative and conjugative element protein (TIGR02256 family)
MIHWFKKHPGYLDREVKALELDSNYRQTLLVRDNLLISQGFMLVRLDGVHRFPFLIVYPNATPYALPMFFPLTAEFSEAEMYSLAKLDETHAIALIKKKVRYYYHLRHQNASGLLCTVEWQSLEGEQNYLGIKTLIKRVTDWCRGTITGVFPPDSEEVEFTGHFNDLLQGVNFLYPDHFLSGGTNEGEAFATIFTRVPKAEFYLHGQTGYLGRMIFGKASAGLFTKSAHQFPEVLTERGIVDEITLLQKSELLEEILQADDQLIRIFWFELEKEPEPFAHFSELVTLIGNGDKDKGAARIAEICLKHLQTKPAEFYLAIRFRGRKGQMEFQLLKVFKNSVNSPVLFSAGPVESLLTIAEGYDRVAAITSNLYSDQAYHLRNQGRADRNLLGKKLVNLIGVGAVGSEIADMLGKAGIGGLVMVDNQRMEIENSVRHLAGVDYAGVPKVEAVKSLVAMHNPFIRIFPYAGDINSIPIEQLFSEGSLSVSSLAEDNTEAFLNERSVILGHTVYYVRALRGGKAGRIFRVVPGKDACLRCLEIYRLEQREFVSIPEDISLPVLRTECNNPVRSASAADLKLIASLASRILLDELEQGQRENNHWIWSTEAISGLDPFSLTSQTIGPHPRCIYCHHDRKHKVWIAPDCLNELQQLVTSSPGKETGGVLAGFLNPEGDFVITHGSGPGPKAVRSLTEFKKDVAFCQAYLDDLSKASGHRTVYLGEWHSHPSLNNMPSGTDIKSLSDISYQKEYLTDKPIMIIFSSTGSPSVTVHPTGKRFYHTEIDQLK